MNPIRPTLDEVRQHRAPRTIIPFSREIVGDLDTPLSCYVKMKEAWPESPSFILESVEAQEKTGRYSFIGIDPFLVAASTGRLFTVSGVMTDDRECSDPFTSFQDLMKSIHFADTGALPAFPGGAVGYAGYDMVRFFERLPEENIDDLGIFDMAFQFPEKLVIIDNVTRTIVLVVFRYCSGIESTEDLFRESMMRLDELTRVIRSPLKVPVIHRTTVSDVHREMQREEFEAIVSRAKEYIYSGDIFQVVLSQRFRLETDCDAITLYRALRMVNPSPYMFFLDFGPYSLIGSSPETSVRLVDGMIEVKPIAGTRKRGRDDDEDALLEAELLSDEKERAEHVMLIDLGRNDVGRVASPGTVTLPEFMKIDRYSHVMHIVSSVKGRIRDNIDGFDVFRATFPAGTVSGAPKVRAMEIIEELEQKRRSFYAGAVGYFAFNGDMDFCIAIRTMLKKDNTVYIQAGAGIVADSRPEAEYDETVHKSMALVGAIQTINTMVEDICSL